ncbi:hypothetical protein A9G11_11115 [Gilliamella sp. wkB108]|uniref:hypothetical protein n=2 Tax=Gilliamella sp. wkB108 TaxID=3120256 RepID=UPI00080ED380|nr:hypothetical protein [Gilliamella apicola]OCG28355.1 hypothetical protein A9G11_11115 [Gilliamella apicola]
MVMILWHFYKLLSNVLLFLLLIGISNQVIASEHPYYYCNLNLVIDYDIDGCADFFEEKISSLSAEQKQHFEEDFEEVKAIGYVPEYLIPFLRQYPTPEVLFTSLQLDEEDDKEHDYNNTKVAFDDLESVEYNEHLRKFQMYKIVEKMLEKKKELTLREKNILSISKQRSQCLDNILDDLRENPGKSIAKKIIIDKCYN